MPINLAFLCFLTLCTAGLLHAQPSEPILTGEIEAFGLMPNGDMTEEIGVQVEERIAMREIPLLPYIFFEQGSSDIPERYLRPLPDGSAGPLAAYHELLRTIGRRLAEHPRERITLTGTISMPEGNDRELARKRAEAVRSYLEQAFGIPRDRIRVESRGLPSRPSSSAHSEGNAENRRVEIVLQ